MTLADRLVVLRAGAVEQEGPPLEVYQRPASRFVAGFLGSPAMNFFTGSIDATGRFAEAPGLRVSVDPARFASLPPGRPVLIGVRPHDVIPDPDGAIDLHVEVVEPMGFEAYAHGTVGGVAFVARLEGGAALPRPGERLPLRVAAAAVHLFDPTTERSLDAGRS